MIILKRKNYKNLIKEVVEIENGDNDISRKTTIYKNIIKILDEVTLRGHSQENSDKYKRYYKLNKNALKNSPKMY